MNKTNWEKYYSEVRRDPENRAKLDKISRDIDISIQLLEEIKEKERTETCLELLAMFDDYNMPLKMSAAFVREQIIKFMEGENE